MSAPVELYDVVRPLADGETYWLIGRALPISAAQDLAAFHRRMDHKYAGRVHLRTAITPARCKGEQA